MNNYYSWKEDDLYLSIHLKPRAKKNGFAEVHNNKLKIFLTSPPIEGKANKHLITFIAEVFHVTKKQVIIIKGENNPDKVLKIKKPDYIMAKKILATLK